MTSNGDSNLLEIKDELDGDSSATKEPSNSRTMSAFLILNSMIGSGIFNQPHVFSQAGLVGATLMLTVTAIFVWIGMISLVEVGIYTSTYDYPSLGQVCLGKMGKRMVNWSIIIMGVGSIMSYIVLLGLFSTTLFASWYVYVYINVFMRMYVHLSMDTCIYIYTFTYVYIYIYIRICLQRTHTHIQGLVMGCERRYLSSHIHHGIRPNSAFLYL
jgi:amino acid permease